MHNESKDIRVWLLVGLAMIFFQIVLGGITRLTGSGLSITRWEIVTGTIPPLTDRGWQEAFGDYKKTPQYELLNRGMSLREFKFIYFWEYLHRLWARSLGIVFLVPLGFFMIKGKITKWLFRRLLIIFLLGCVVGVFGWLMVSSGLVDRPWVNAYKLAIHLVLALILLSYLLITYLKTCHIETWQVSKPFRIGLTVIISLTIIQVVLGGLMAGMKAALLYPTFPDYHGFSFPQVLVHNSSFFVEYLIQYDSNPWIVAWIQVLHRTVAYILIISMLIFNIKTYIEWKEERKLIWLYIWNIVLITQISLGIITLINSIGKIPVTWGVLHQAMGILYLSLCLYFIYITSEKRDLKEFFQGKSQK